MTRYSRVAIAIAVFVVLGACKPSAPAPASADDAVAAPATLATDAGAGSSAAAVADALNPLATSKDAMLASMQAFRNVRSYHATMTMEGGPQGTITNEMDFVAPDRYRIAMRARGMEVRNVRIGNDTWMTMGGRTTKVTMPPGSMDQWQDLMEQGKDTMTVEAQGSESIDGVATRKYLMHQTQPKPSDVTVWINGDDLVEQARMLTDHQGASITTTIRYSRYNDPSIRIDPP